VPQLIIRRRTASRDNIVTLACRVVTAGGFVPFRHDAHASLPKRTDVTELLSLLDPDVELQTPGGPRLRGHDQAREWYEMESENVQSRLVPDRFGSLSTSP
jgi:hypothetical protein